MSLDTTVLLMKFTFRASCKRNSAAIPAGHVVRDDVVGHGDAVPVGSELFGKRELLCRSRPAGAMPPPLPLSAAVALDQVGVDDQTRARHHRSAPAGNRCQSWSAFDGHTVHDRQPSGAAPITRIPPPLVGIVGLKLWLKMTRCARCRRCS